MSASGGGNDPLIAVFNGAACGIAVGMLVVSVQTHDGRGIAVWAVLTAVNVGYCVPWLIRLWFGWRPKKKGRQ